jgi:hypothetical protein
VNRPAEMPDDMFLVDIDPDSIERLLAGRMPPDDAPRRFREAARTVRALRSPGSANELATEPLAVREALVLLEQPVIDHRGARPRRMIARARIGALVFAGMMIATTGAAAANVLPERLERPIARVLSHVGVTVEAGATTEPPRTVLRPPGASHRSRESTVPPSHAPGLGADHGAVVRSAVKSRAGRRKPPTPEHSTGPRTHQPPGHANGRVHRPPGQDVRGHRHPHADDPLARGPDGEDSHHRNGHVSPSHSRGTGHIVRP